MPPAVRQLYQKQQPTSAKPRFGGSKVDVTNVPVPPRSLQERRVKALQPTDKKPPLFAIIKGKTAIRQKTHLGHNERKIILILLSLAAVALVLAGLIFLPQAQVEMVLETAPLLIDQELAIGAGTGEPDRIPGMAYAREVQVEGVSPVLSKEVVGTKASGTVSLVNRTIDEQKIVEQSRLVAANGTLYYMQRHAIIPPNSSVAIPVEAAQAGEGGNISSGRLNFAALAEASQALVYAEIDQPVNGGSGEEVAVVKQADLDQARAAAQTAARQRSEEEIRSELEPGWTLLEESWDIELLEFTPQSELDDRKDAIAYTARANVRVLGYEEAALEDRLAQVLDDRLDANYMLFPGPISFTKAVDSIDWEKGESRITVRVTHTTIPSFSLPTLRDKLAGRSRGEAEEYIRGLNGVTAASIKLAPFWVRKVPRIDRRISIDLVSDRQP